jgi:hypothetical protein
MQSHTTQPQTAQEDEDEHDDIPASPPFPRALVKDKKTRRASPPPPPPPPLKPSEYRYKRGEHIGKSLTEAP